MKNLVIAALLGAMTFSDVQGAQLRQLSAGDADAAAAAARKAGVPEDKEANANKATIQAQSGAEQKQSQEKQSQEAADKKAVEAEVQAAQSAQAKVDAARAGKEKTPEEKQEEMNQKITAVIEARKRENEAILEAARRAKEAQDEADSKHRWNEAQKIIDRTQQIFKDSGVKPEGLTQLASESDDDEDDEDVALDAEMRSDDDSTDDDEEVGLNESADDDDDDEDEDVGLNQDPQPNQQQQPAQGLAQKDKKKDRYSGHLHRTNVRVDPPLLEDGKKSIAEAEKALEESKKDYDVKAAKAQEKELAFHAASRISKAAREERAKAEDRYYISSKAARKAMRLSENLEREARLAAAKQAAADKYAEVISAANKEASAKDAAKAAAAQTAAKPAAAAAAAPAAAAAKPAAAVQTNEVKRPDF